MNCMKERLQNYVLHWKKYLMINNKYIHKISKYIRGTLSILELKTNKNVDPGLFRS